MKFLQRLREPSTMAGLSGLAVIVGANPTKVNAVSAVVAAVLSALAVFLPEKGQAE
ncbi:hypothetical protein CMPELA_25675 [Cupriavidus necator]|uniref:hypothetical protein n=1 Tax=Cupriavidus necator TaxID=106590 RepID=UPI000309E8AD|nr:hypothetical protein [Cupriavidus necator]QQB81027.1 hypothetical protein I6H87_25400 [Cupriavidus necator]WKA42861.1 hypothetical protein QWP09_25865 [Cupriavidus necator]